jgi:hypothetical protein
MKLKRFSRRNNILFFLIVTMLLSWGLLKYKVYLNNDYKNYNAFNNTAELAYIIDGEKASNPPLSGDYNVSVSCNNDAIGTWDYDEWGVVVTNAKKTGTKCTISFKSTILLKNYISTLSLTDTTNIATDDSDDANIRFIGADPSNYLCFDEDCTNGKWRVIGIMNNMTTSEGDTTSLIKIIRNESIGSYAWDSNSVNDWTTASLNTYLNGDWYDSNLTDYDNLLESVVWKLGGYSTSAITTSTLYAYERNTVVYSDRPTEWAGKLALMYPSDYGYATGGGDTGRDTCLTYNLYTWGSYSGCYGKDFLYLGSYEWSLMPYSSQSYNAFRLNGSGNANYGNVSSSYAVRPVGYLKPGTKILSGSGTSNDPWIIG